MAIHVETVIAAPIEAVWTRTQDPDLHCRWDLRFTAIEPAPSPTRSIGLRRFRYRTRLAFGRSVEGGGETVGQRDLPDGSRASALRFWSDDRLSLIEEGRGYWRYVPAEDGVRFLTAYDYRTRFGRLGRLIDRIAFRPLIGWATAWSFDRLRLWVERDLDPGRSARLALVHGVARLALAGIFAWHGFVPKLLGPAPDELALVTSVGFGDPGAMVVALGIGELGLAAGLLLAWHRRWPVVATVAFVAVTLPLVAVASPGTVIDAFGPVSVDVGILGLAIVDLLLLDDIPSAARCRRQPPEARP